MTILYSYWRSSASWRVRLALGVKGIDYEYRAVSLIQDGGQQHSEAYTELNPARLLPALEIDGVTLSESLAIVGYLERTRPDPPLVPADPYLAAKAWQIAELVNAGIQPLQNLRTLKRLGSQFGADPAAQTDWARHWIEQGLEPIEQIVHDLNGIYCVGDTVTVADICLVPQLYNARRYHADLGRFPHLLAADAALSTLPAFEAAHPDAQPDAPKG